MTFDASASGTGVEAVHTAPLQWLNTTVDEYGCHVTRRHPSIPRPSGKTTVRVLTSSTR
jgi:hypothetical protein